MLPDVVRRAMDLAKNLIADAMNYPTEADYERVKTEVTQALDAVVDYVSADSAQGPEPEVPVLADVESAAGVERR
jgi:hypothetical protein